MPYPAKLTAETILAAALSLLHESGLEALSMRPLAEKLEVRPSSLYRHFAAREVLLDALEAHATHALHGAIAAPSAGLPAREAFVAAAHAYREYAHAEPHLYALLLRERAPYVAGPGPGKDLWNTVLALVGGVTGNPDDTAAAVVFWAFIHGFVGLERSGQFGSSGPKGGFERGLGALLTGLERTGGAS